MKVLQAGLPLPVSQLPSSALVASSFLLVSSEAVSSFFRVLHECLFRLSPGGGGNRGCLAWKSQLAGDTLRVRRASQCLDIRPRLMDATCLQGETGSFQTCIHNLGSKTLLDAARAINKSLLEADDRGAAAAYQS